MEDSSRLFLIVSIFVYILSGIFAGNQLLSYSGIIVASLLTICTMTKTSSKPDRKMSIFLLLIYIVTMLVKMLIQNTGGA